MKTAFYALMLITITVTHRVTIHLKILTKKNNFNPNNFTTLQKIKSLHLSKDFLKILNGVENVSLNLTSDIFPFQNTFF